MNREETIKVRENIEFAVNNYLKYSENITSARAGIGESFKSILEIINHIAQSEEKNTNEWASLKYGGSFRHKIYFQNGYGISLVYHDGSYGLECALIHKDVEGIIQTNKIFNEGGDSVKPYLDGDTLLDALTIVKNLKPKHK